jgi:integrase
LNNTKIKNLKPKDKIYRVSDGNGLVLEVKPNGKKYFRVRYTLFKKAKMYSIGEYPVISLAEARQECLNVKNKVAKGIDPVVDRQEKVRAAVISSKKLFANIVDEFVRFKAKSLSKKYIEKYSLRITNYILPELGDKDIDKITKSDIIKTIKAVKDKKFSATTRQTDKSETTKRIFSILQNIYKFALHNDYVETDVTSRIDINSLVPKSKVIHYKAITNEAEVKKLYKELTGYKSPLVALALEFLALSALRPGNIRNLKWEWVDMDKKIVFIPAEDMKMREDFRLPLTDRMIRILKKSEEIVGKRFEYVFCSPVAHSKRMSENTLNKVHKTVGYAHNAHGWRSSFSTICYEKQREHGFSYEVIETQLAHTVGNKVTRAYMRSDFIDERRKLLEWWDGFLNENS